MIISYLVMVVIAVVMGGDVAHRCPGAVAAEARWPE
jgi:hypothetical protein